MLCLCLFIILIIHSKFQMSWAYSGGLIFGRISEIDYIQRDLYSGICGICYEDIWHSIDWEYVDKRMVQIKTIVPLSQDICINLFTKELLALFYHIMK